MCNQNDHYYHLRLDLLYSLPPPRLDFNTIYVTIMAVVGSLVGQTFEEGENVWPARLSSRYSCLW